MGVHCDKVGSSQGQGNTETKKNEIRSNLVKRLSGLESTIETPTISVRYLTSNSNKTVSVGFNEKFSLVEFQSILKVKARIGTTHCWGNLLRRGNMLGNLSFSDQIRVT